MSVLSVSFPASGTLLGPMPTCASCLSDSSDTSRPLDRLSCSVKALQTPHHILIPTVLLLSPLGLTCSSRVNSPPPQFRRRSRPERSLSHFVRLARSHSRLRLSHPANLTAPRLNILNIIDQDLRFTTCLQILYSSNLPSAPSSHSISDRFEPPLS